MKSYKKIFLIILLVLFSSSAFAQEGTYVEVEGVAAINRGNIVQAKELATNDAFRNAIRRVVGTFIDSKTIVKNAKLIEDSIFAKSRGYVASYEVLDSWMEDGIFHIKLKALVKKDILGSDVKALDLIIHKAGDPRIMVIIPEEHITRPVPDPAAETEIIRKLLESGFRLIDQNQIKKVRNSEIMRRALNNEAEAYLQLKAEYDADLLVIGEAFSELVGTRQGLFSCRARVEVRVVKTDTAEIIAAHGVHESGVDITESASSKKSLANAGSKMADYLLEVLPKAISDAERSLQLSITGVSFLDIQDIETDLKSIHLIDSVYLRNFAGGAARLDLNTSLLPMQLAREIISNVRTPLEVTGVSGTKLELRKKD